jgi:cellulose synthase/poly-beta-1,6-N-acetylglucosamine synthase-like glycosyltransferase
VTIVIWLCRIWLAVTVVVLTVYAIRHYLFVLYRLSVNKTRDMMEVVGFTTPTVSVLIPMHNEEKVAADVLQALVDCDYDWNRLEIIAIDDRSEDGTGEIVDDFAARYPIVKPLHRTKGEGGKGAALKVASAQARGEIILLFDADYIPGRAMIKLLVAPFCDPEVGAVMGRVVPNNGGASVLAGLLELERGAGYQVGQQARYCLGLTPQFGGTVGGVRAEVLKTVGGWNTNSLTEDTDLTFRLLLRGWKVAYVNRAECYEEAPESWQVRSRQIRRWAIGHTECLHAFWKDWLRSKVLSRAERVDGFLVLACYWTAPILVLGWLASLVLFFTPRAHTSVPFLVALSFMGYQLFGNQATFLELGAAALLDGNRRRVMLLPLNLFNFFASTGAICLALMSFYVGGFFGSGPHYWHKTKRYRNGNGNGNGNRNGNGPHANGGNGTRKNGNGNGRAGGNGGVAGKLLVRAPNGLYLARPQAELD